VSELYLLRHAKAEPQNEGTPDRDRPLTARGQEGARATARWIAKHKLDPDLVLCSPAARTRETLDIVAASFPRRCEIAYDKALYLADSDALLARLREIPEGVQRVMVIGHNPGLHELAQALSDVTTGALANCLAQGLPTAALARFEIGVEWAGLIRRGARLVALVSPKELRG
jgi:phosphohistidine phosphatase